MYKVLAIAGIVLFAISLSLAQVKPYDFPKIKPETFTASKTDSNACAVVLGDKGETYYEYVDNKGFQMIFKRHIRIRILTEQGYKYATKKIELYSYNGLEEKVSELKAYTYNLVDNKVREDKLDGDNIFDEKIDSKHSSRNFTLPNVKRGSIIDIRYSIISDIIWYVREWNFQDLIPVNWSEYTVTIPEYLIFSKLMHGAVPFAISEVLTVPGNATLTFKDRTEGNIVQTSFSTETVQFNQSQYHFATSDVPAIQEEPYSIALTNYISKVEFEIKQSKFPSGGYHTYTSTWSDICKMLIKAEDFGGQLNRAGIVKEMAASLKKQYSDPVKLMIAAHDIIRKKMTWNGNDGKYPVTNLKDAFNKSTGNDADINLLLVMLLRELDLSSFPVVLSTRDNGLLVTSHPEFFQLNYVLASVKIDNKTYLLDATNKNRSYKYLPYDVLNGSGLIVAQEGEEWVPLLDEEKENSLFHAEAKISPDGTLNGNVTISGTGYPFESFRNSYFSKGEEFMVASMKETYKTFKPGEISFINIDSIEAPLTQNFKFSSDEIVQTGGNTIYFNSMLGIGENENPFKAEKRESIIDFVCPKKKTFILSYELPEGYMVESLPEQLKLSLPDQAGSFRYLVSADGRKINVTSSISLNKIQFNSDEYETLREFYKQIITKHSQQIVLKKI